MRNKQYWVDWVDPEFPEIRSADSDTKKPASFAECKRQIIEYFQGRETHAKFMIRRIRKLRVRDLQPDADQPTVDPTDITQWSVRRGNDR